MQDTLADADELRAKIQRVLVDKDHFIRSAKASFTQYDETNSGFLNFEQLELLVKQLCNNFCLPAIEPEVLLEFFKRFDFDNDSQLSIREFAQLYRRLLQRIQSKYYPQKDITVKRDTFVGHNFVSRTEGGIEAILIFEKKIGAGSFGEVHLVREVASGMSRVCKTINKNQVNVPAEQIEAEIVAMKQLDHPNVIKIYDVYEDATNVYITMEQCKGGELMDRIQQAQVRGKALTEIYARFLMKQILRALAYFHSVNVLHKDLKPENVLFCDDSPSSSVKVIDFGLSEIFTRRDSVSHNAAGTILYMAPEVFRRRLELKCDVWSAGCIMYLILSGHLPFTGKTAKEIKQKIFREEPNYRLHCKHLSPACLDLLKHMLEKDSRQRFSAIDCLRHEWFEIVSPRAYETEHYFGSKSDIPRSPWLAPTLNKDRGRAERQTREVRDDKASDLAGGGQAVGRELSPAVAAVGAMATTRDDSPRIVDPRTSSGLGYNNDEAKQESPDSELEIIRSPTPYTTGRPLLLRQQHSLEAENALTSTIRYNLRVFSKLSCLKIVLLNFMAHQLNSNTAQLRQLTRAFAALDNDKDGLVSNAEMAEAMVECGMQPWDVSRIVQALDLDDSGFVSFTEWVAGAYSWRERELYIAWTAFNKLAKSADGTINVADLATLLAGRTQISPEKGLVVQRLVAEADLDGDGVISWEDFAAYIRGV